MKSPPAARPELRSRWCRRRPAFGWRSLRKTRRRRAPGEPRRRRSDHDRPSIRHCVLEEFERPAPGDHGTFAVEAGTLIAMATAAKRSQTGRMSGPRVRRPHAAKPDIVAEVRTHAGDACIFVVPRTQVRRDRKGVVLILGR